ncbi:MAG: hypothetical protein R3E79_35610 [Caldilineaceae bacterium]
MADNKFKGFLPIFTSPITGDQQTLLLLTEAPNGLIIGAFD